MGSYNFNRFHIIVFIAWQFNIMFGVQQIFPIFLNLVPKWRCLFSIEGGFNETLTENVYSKNCEIYKACPKEMLEFEVDFYSAAIEFGWICTENAKFLIAFLGFIQYFGVFCGTIFFGFITDIFGRKKVAIFVLTFGLSILTMSGVLINPTQLFICRYLIGLTNGGSIVVITTYVHELVLPQQRMAIKTYTNWGSVRLLTTGICYYFANWRYSCMICAICALPALFIIIFLLPESPPWLYSKKKYSQLKESQAYISKIGKAPFHALPPEASNQKFNYLDIWKNPKARILMIILGLMWFTASITSYTNDLNSTAIPGGFWFVQSLFSLVGSLASIGLGITDYYYPKLNRRNLHHYNQFLAILCFIGVGILFYLKLEGVLLLTLYIAGSMCIGYTWDACYLCTIESVPTSVRGSALGTCSLVARIGALLSPLLAMLASLWQPAAYIVVCLIGTINLTMSWLFLPDTKGIDLTRVRVKLHHQEESSEAESLRNEKISEVDSFRPDEVESLEVGKSKVVV